MNRADRQRKYYEDSLVIRARRPNGNVISQGKRVGKDCPLTKAERHEYVTKGTVFAVKLIKEGRDIGLAEALKLLNDARGGSPLTRRT